MDDSRSPIDSGFMRIVRRSNTRNGNKIEKQNHNWEPSPNANSTFKYNNKLTMIDDNNYYHSSTGFAIVNNKDHNNNLIEDIW